MTIIFRPLLFIIAYALVLYVVSDRGLLNSIEFIFQAQSRQDIVKIYLLIWLVFAICFGIVKRVVSLFALPLQFLTLGLIGFVINIAIFYLCQFLIDVYIDGVTMNILSLQWLAILSLLLSVLVSFVYRLLKRII